MRRPIVAAFEEKYITLDLPHNPINIKIMQPKLPKLPSRIGKTTCGKWIDGSPMIYRVMDEIVHIPKHKTGKAFYFQLLEVDGGDQIMRLCYYMIGQKGRTKGKWVFGRFAPMISKDDFLKIISEAKKRHWL